jgi:hypothetical protein
MSSTDTKTDVTQNAIWSLPKADAAKEFLKDRTANIFWRFKLGVFGAMSQRQYNPVSMSLKYELTPDEVKKIKDTFAAAGWEAKVTKNEVDSELDYKTKIDIYFA